MSGDCLRDHGIRLRSHAPGEHRAACPACAQAKARARDDALAVHIDHDGSATWLCHRCGWKGGLGRALAYCTRASSTPATKAGDLVDNVNEVLPQALALYQAGLTITTDDPVSRYLIGRGCAIPSPEADLRWLPAHRHPCGYNGPVILALLTDAFTNEPRTVHQTWLAQDGSGKAPVEKPRCTVLGCGVTGRA